MKKCLPLVAIAALTLSACTTAPASVLEREARLGAQQEQYSEQLSAWEKEQQDGRSQEYVAEAQPGFFLNLFEQARVRSSYPSDIARSGDTSFIFELFVNGEPDSETAIDSISIHGEAAPGEAIAEGRCLGSGSLDIAVLADGVTYKEFTVGCGVLETRFSEPLVFTEPSEFIEFIFLSPEGVNGALDFSFSY